MGLIIVAGAQLAFALQNVFIERMDRAMGPDRAMPILEVRAAERDPPMEMARMDCLRAYITWHGYG